MTAFDGLRRAPALPGCLLLSLVLHGCAPSPTEREPEPASVEVLPPSPAIHAGEGVQMSAVVRDQTGQPLPGAVVRWSGSDDAVATVSASGAVSGVRPGTATVTATSGSASGSTVVTVLNRPPQATVTAPESGTAVEEGAAVELRGNASDPEDGTLGGASLVWSSSLDGQLGTGASVTRADLSVGAHTITLTATDSEGASATASVALTVRPRANAPPVAAIASPADGASFPDDATIAFQGSAADAEDGALSGEALVWTSSSDGRLGTGASLARDDLSAGSHTITLTATDSEGASGSAAIQVTVTETTANTPPAATITSPPPGASFQQGSPVAFQGGATDAEEGALSGTALVWTSSRDGQLGTGGSFTRSDLSVGAHLVTLTATDSEGASGSVAVTISVDAAPPTVHEVVLTPDFAWTAVGAAASPFAVVARDAAGGTIEDPAVVWTSSAVGVVSVDGTGRIEGVASGQADLVATVEGRSDRARVAVLASDDVLATALPAGAFEAGAAAGQTLQVPLALDMSRVSAQGDLGSISLQLLYDVSVLTYRSAQQNATGLGQVNEAAPGDVRAVLVTTNVQGSAAFTLFTLTFEVKSGATTGQASALALSFRERPSRTDASAYTGANVVVAGVVVVR